MGQVRKRFWFEAGTAAASGVPAVVTVFWKEWIEVAGWDPDHGSGAAEWLVVVALALVSLLSAVAARVEWRAQAPATP